MVAGGLLCLISGAVSVWQNGRVAVLWDLSFILDIGWRIAAGDVPYRDFPLAYPPGSFLVSALLIRLFDASWVHFVAYAAALTTLATWVTIRMARLVLEPIVGRFEWVAVAVAVPLTVLGVCDIYPHPFYDSDACTVMLLSLWGILKARKTGSARLALAGGALLVLPIFIKQNIGLAAFGLVHGALLVEWVKDRAQRATSRWVFLGSALGLAAVLIATQAFVGLGAYVEWTISFAFARRAPPVAGLFDLYRDWAIWVWIAAIAAAIAAGVRLGHERAGRWLTLTLLLVPVLWVLTGVFGAGDDVLFPRRNLLSLWPLAMLLAVPVTVQLVRARGLRFEALLPVVFLGITHASLLSQGVKGSTYGIWPLWVVGLACGAAALCTLPRPVFQDLALPVTASIGVFTALAGVAYVVPNHRLTYIKMVGPMAQASTARLAGMHTQGNYLPELDAVLAFCDRTIPRDDAIITLPGEDPFFFALRRRPQFPLTIFESTTLNPYPDDRLIALMRERNVRWVVLKRRLQVIFVPMDLTRILAVVARDYRSVYRSDMYEVFERVAP